MQGLKSEGRHNLAQIFAGAVNAGAQLEDISLESFIGSGGDAAEECGTMMLESMLSAELTGLINLDLSFNTTFFKSPDFY